VGPRAGGGRGGQVPLSDRTQAGPGTRPPSHLHSGRLHARPSGAGRCPLGPGRLRAAGLGGPRAGCAELLPQRQAISRARCWPALPANVHKRGSGR
jgi:hypothetical protein